MNGEHHAVAEAVVGTRAVVAPDRQAKVQQQLAGGVVGVHRACQGFPTGRCIADVKARRDLAGEPALFQVLDRAAGLLVGAQLLLVPGRHAFQQLVQGCVESGLMFSRPASCGTSSPAW